VTALPALHAETASAAAADLLNAVEAAFGTVPNLARVMANSPALLGGYLELSGALNYGVLNARTRELIVLAVAEGNGCAYCPSAHAYFAEHAGHLSRADIDAARRGTSTDARVHAVLDFASAVNSKRGGVSDAELGAVRDAGVTDEEIAEIIGHVAVNVLTTFFAKATRVPAEFPLVTPHDDAA
jgi:uncharacterized peroxidase-related enzyme